MKLKAVVTEGAPEGLFEAFGSPDFAVDFLTEVVGNQLGAEDPVSRPAEYYVQKPDVTVNTGAIGVELRLTGVSRGNRKAAQFHKALSALVAVATGYISAVLTGAQSDDKVQLFCVLMLDADVETTPGSGIYSSTLESPAVWVTRQESSGEVTNDDLADRAQ